MAEAVTEEEVVVAMTVEVGHTVVIAEGLTAVAVTLTEANPILVGPTVAPPAIAVPMAEVRVTKALTVALVALRILTEAEAALIAGPMGVARTVGPQATLEATGYKNDFM